MNDTVPTATRLSGVARILVHAGLLDPARAQTLLLTARSAPGPASAAPCIRPLPALMALLSR